MKLLISLILLTSCSTVTRPCNYHSESEPNLERKQQLKNLEDLCRYDIETRRR